MWSGESLKNAPMLAWQRYCKPLTTPALLTLLVALPACSTTLTRLTIPPAKCSEFVAKSEWLPVIGVDASNAESQRDWAAAFVGQTGNLEVANRKPPYILDTLQACEKREQEIYNALNGKRRRFFGIF
jgi:hypothetical protein